MHLYEISHILLINNMLLSILLSSLGQLYESTINTENCQNVQVETLSFLMDVSYFPMIKYRIWQLIVLLVLL
jgi:hypothetical protein